MHSPFHEARFEWYGCMIRMLEKAAVGFARFRRVLGGLEDNLIQKSIISMVVASVIVGRSSPGTSEVEGRTEDRPFFPDGCQTSGGDP